MNHDLLRGHHLLFADPLTSNKDLPKEDNQSDFETVTLITIHETSYAHKGKYDKYILLHVRANARSEKLI